MFFVSWAAEKADDVDAALAADCSLTCSKATRLKARPKHSVMRVVVVVVVVVVVDGAVAGSYVSDVEMLRSHFAKQLCGGNIALAPLSEDERGHFAQQVSLLATPSTG